MRKLFDTEEKRYLFAQAVMTGMVLLCLASIASKFSIWFDESFTINLVRKKVPELIRLTALDVHPPLYYLAVRFCITVFGESVFSLYMTSVLCYIGFLAVTALFFRRFFSAEISFFVTAAFCALPNMMQFAVQLRMYSMAMFLVALSFYLTYVILLRMKNGGVNRRLNKYFAGLAAVNVLAAYTHYFAGVAAAGISLFLLACLLYRRGNRWKALLNWGIFCFVMLLLYLPWMPVLLRQMSAVDGDYWIQPITEASLHSYWEMVFTMPDSGLRMLLIALYLIGFFLFLLNFSADRKSGWMGGCYAVLLFWLAFGIGYSVFCSPILIDRYLLVLLPLVWLPVLLSYASFSGKNVRGAALLLFALCFVDNYENLYKEYTAGSWEDMKDYISENASPEDIFFHFDVQSLSMWEAFLPEMEHCFIEGTDSGEAFRYWPELVDTKMVESVQELADAEGNIWCLSGNSQPLFEEMGYQVESIEWNDHVVFKIHK